MSGIQGKSGRNIRKLQVAESTIPAVGFKNIRALHEAAANDTIIDVTSLTTPAQAAANGFVNPSLSDLSKVNLKQYKNNVVVRTGTGQLIQDIDYVVNGATTITLSVPALDAQVFEIVIDAAPRSGTIIADAQPLVVTGTLAMGDTDFNVGQPFQVGLYPSMQHGSVMVMVDGQLAYRNVGNQPDGEGDYYEVHAGAGLGVIIRFNTPDLSNDRNISVMSVGSLVEKPDGSLTALVETLQGQIDTHREYIEALAGETVAPGAPNNVDLKAFGDRVFAAEQNIDNHETRITSLENPEALATFVYKNDAQNVQNQYVTFNNTDLNNTDIGTWASDTFTAAKAGWYEVACHFAMASTTAIPFIRVNNITRIDGWAMFTTSANFTAMVEGMVYLNANDTIRIFATAGGGGTGVAATTRGNSLSIKWLGL